jgi:hypothetical protein
MIYCYEDESGNVSDLSFPLGKAPRTTIVDGVKLKRCYAAERKSFPATAGWPMECYASGVNANQAQELRDHFDKAGVPTEVTPDGDPVYRNPKHRKKALKCRGLVDKDSFI